MGLILFQLFFNYTIGSYVSFQKKAHKIMDIKFIHPFMRRNTLLKSTWKRPFWFCVALKNQYGGVEIVGEKAIKPIWDAENIVSYSSIKF